MGWSDLSALKLMRQDWAVTEKQLRLRRPDRCRACGVDLLSGSMHWWDPEAKVVTCTACHDGVYGGPAIEAPPRVTGEAGASALRNYERRSARESARKTKAVTDDAEWRARIKAERPVLGRVAAAVTAKPVVTPESQATRAWAQGAEGEQRVAEILDACSDVYALHDRRIPGKRSNIDHIAVSSTAVYVIDAKRYTGAIEARNVGGWLREDFRLYVNNRDVTKLADDMVGQVDTVRDTLGAEYRGIRVEPVLCFVGCTWQGFRPKPFLIRGVGVLWPTALAKFLARPNNGPAHDPAAVAQAIARALRPA